MEFCFLTIPALDPAAGQDDLNRLCAGRRIVSVDRQFVADGQASYWALCVVIASGAGPLPDAMKSPEQRRGASRSGPGAASRIDYKQVLSEADFARYAALRAWRKQTAEQEGVPLFAIFTNEQLAEIARRKIDGTAALGEIDGIGAARLDRYGAALVALLQEPEPPP